MQMMVTMQQSVTQLHISMEAKERQRELERAEEKAARAEKDRQELVLKQRMLKLEEEKIKDMTARREQADKGREALEKYNKEQAEAAATQLKSNWRRRGS